MAIAILGAAEGHIPLERIAFRSERPLGDFDAVLWDPNTLPAEYSSELETEGVLSVHGSELLLADLRRRRRDLADYIASGGILVIVPPGAAAFRVHTLETIITVPVSRALPVDISALDIMAADCRPAAIEFRGGEPFRSFWTRVGSVLDPRRQLERWVGQPLFFESGSDHVLGAYAAHGRGHLLLFPAPRLDCWNVFIDALGPLIEALALDDTTAPRWLTRYVGAAEQPLRDEIDDLTRKRAEIDHQIDAIDRRLLRFARRKRLFTSRGRELVEAVAEAFTLLGYSAYQGPFSDSDLVIEGVDGTALANIVGCNNAVPGEALVNLGDWLDADLFRGEQRPNGLLVVNPYRQIVPESRPPLAPALVAAAAAARVAIISGFQLFGSLSGVGQHFPGTAKLGDLLAFSGRRPR